MLAPHLARLTLRVSQPHNRLELLTASAGLSMTQATTGTDQELQLFETRIDELVTLTMQLREENRALRQRLDGLMTERATLLQKNEQVRARVEAMIGRLKAMEHGA
jgi:cell division protein ZapB